MVLINTLISYVMKKVLYSFLIIVSAISCHDSISEVTYKEKSPAQAIFVELEDISGTKTILDENNNILWNTGDQIIAFMQTNLPAKYVVDSQSVGTQNGNFTLVEESGSAGHIQTGTELSNNIILYPYSESTVCSKADDALSESSYRLGFTIPAIQVYQEGSFASQSFPMVAVSSGNRFCFRNLCGAIILPIRGEVAIKSITLSGCGNEVISGTAEILAYLGSEAPSISMKNTLGHEVTLSCPDPVQINTLSVTPFIISVVPTEFQTGMVVKIVDSDDRTYVFTNSSPNVVKRSGLLRMPEITLGYISMIDVNLDHTEISLVEGSKFQLNPIFTPLNPSNTIVKWQSSDQSVATVTNGEVTAVSPGTAQITVTTDDGGFSAICVVTVKPSGAKPDEGGLEGTEDEDLNI